MVDKHGENWNILIANSKKNCSYASAIDSGAAANESLVVSPLTTTSSGHIESVNVSCLIGQHYPVPKSKAYHS